MEQFYNGVLAVTASTRGAVMQSLKHLGSGRELLWQGDPRYWHGRSPVLFPATGGLWNGTCRVNGQAFRTPKHGFMREKTWTPAAHTADSVAFVYESHGEDAAAFPWPYAVRVTYSLDGATVRADFSVENRGDTPMFFQMGGHPGIALPDFDEAAACDGYLKLEGRPESVVRAGRQGCIEPGTHDYPQTADGLVPLCTDTFAHEALIFKGGQVRRATVLDKARRPLVAVESAAPVWLFWSPQGVHAPFVCAEPWYGLCDRAGFEGDISERPYINRLAPGETWHGGYTVEVLL